MDATITNLGTTQIFVPGPNMDLLPTGDPDGKDSAVWPDVTVADLDSQAAIKTLVVAGTLSVAVSHDPEDVAAATVGSMSPHAMPSYAVASLPTGFNGRVAYASDGRAGAEGASSGTGTLVVFTNASWRRLEDLAVVAA